MNPVFGLYTQIRSNRIRSAFMLAGLVALVYVLVFAGALVAEALSHGDRPLPALLQAAGGDLLRSAPVATIGLGLWIAGAGYFHQKLIDAVTGARGVSRAEEPKLYAMLENLCVSRGMATPRLEILPSEALNAYATGMNDKQYAITVTTALRDALTDAEMEAVLGHELTHIRNEDVRMMMTAVVIAGVVSFFAELIFRMLSNFRWSGGDFGGRSDGDRKKNSSGGGAFAAVLIGLALIAAAWLLSQLIRFGLSRSREFMADAGSVELTKNPDAMISALLKIAGRGEIEGAPSGVMELCVDNPRSGFADLFATHPSIDARVDALVRFAGGRLPGPPALDAAPESEERQEAGFLPPDGASPIAQPGISGPWGQAAQSGRWGRAG